MMDTTPSGAGTVNPPCRTPLSPTAAVLLAISIGLCGGYLDLLVMFFVKSFWDEEGYFRTGRDFLWTVPVGHVVPLIFAAVLLAVVSWRRRRVPSLGTGSWLLATLAIWAVLFRLPLYGVASLLLAAGLGRLISGPVTALVKQPARDGMHWQGFSALLGLLAALSSGRQWAREYCAVNSLAAPPPAPRTSC